MNAVLSRWELAAETIAVKIRWFGILFGCLLVNLGDMGRLGAGVALETRRRPSRRTQSRAGRTSDAARSPHCRTHARTAGSAGPRPASGKDGGIRLARGGHRPRSRQPAHLDQLAHS